MDSLIWTVKTILMGTGAASAFGLFIVFLYWIDSVFPNAVAYASFGLLGLALLFLVGIAIRIGLELDPRT